MKRLRTPGLRVLCLLPLLAAVACESATDGVPSEPLVIVEGSRPLLTPWSRLPEGG
jgi:hypothetical protein